ncbi:MAG: recombinase family protein [Planctomycetota bacterium]
MKQFVAWARVSSVKQKKEGFSLEDQEARLLEFAGRLGGTVAKLYRIAETASKRAERGTFRELVAYVKKHAAMLDGVLFVKVDRAARNIRDWADLEELAEQTKVPLFFPDQPSGETPAGRMQRRMSAVFASYQTDQQGDDVKAGLKRRVESGLPLGRHYGLRNLRVNGRSLVEPDPINAPKVKRIFELYAYHSHTLVSLADALARQGVIYTDRRPRFPKATLFDLLTNRHYIGEARHAGIWYPGTFEAIVDLATFQAAQDKFGGRVFRKPQITFASCLIRCDHCDYVVTGEKVRKKLANGTVKEFTYYRCCQNGRPGHPYARIPEREVDAQVVEFFGRLEVKDPSVRQWIVEVIRAKAHTAGAQNKQHRDELARQQAQVEGKLKALLDLRVDGEVSQDEYAAKRRELHERQTAIRLQLETSDRDDREIAEQAVKTFELSQTLKTRWKTADPAAKRAILDILCESVRLNQRKVLFLARKPFSLLENAALSQTSGQTRT